MPSRADSRGCNAAGTLAQSEAGLLCGSRDVAAPKRDRSASLEPSAGPLTSEPPTTIPRLCACGCGANLDGRHANARYHSDACKSRAWRAKTGYTLQAARKPCQTQKKPSGRQVSYRKAVTHLADWLQKHLPNADPTATAEHVLRQALPERQRHHERSVP